MSLSHQLGALLKERKLTIATAESCTAGLIAAVIADTPGSSSWLDSGYVVYTPEAKTRILGVNPETIFKYNIVSNQVATEMAAGAWNLNRRINIVVSTTGVAGPSGGSPEIPVGTVCFGWLFNLPEHESAFVVSYTKVFEGDRNDVRQQATDYALQQTLSYLTTCCGYGE